MQISLFYIWIIFLKHFEDFNTGTKCYVIANIILHGGTPLAVTEPASEAKSFTVPLVKSCPALWPHCPTSHAFSAGIWSEIRQESTETSLPLLLPDAAHSGKWTGWGTCWCLALKLLWQKVYWEKGRLVTLFHHIRQEVDDIKEGLNH